VGARDPGKQCAGTNSIRLQLPSKCGLSQAGMAPHRCNCMGGAHSCVQMQPHAWRTQLQALPRHSPPCAEPVEAHITSPHMGQHSPGAAYSAPPYILASAACPKQAWPLMPSTHTGCLCDRFLASAMDSWQVRWIPSKCDGFLASAACPKQAWPLMPSTHTQGCLCDGDSTCPTGGACIQRPPVRLGHPRGTELDMGPAAPWLLLLLLL